MKPQATPSKGSDADPSHEVQASVALLQPIALSRLLSQAAPSWPTRTGSLPKLPDISWATTGGVKGRRTGPERHKSGLLQCSKSAPNISLWNRKTPIRSERCLKIWRIL